MTSFPTIKIEGGLLGPDIFDQLVSGELSGQKPGDFRLTQSARINDEIAAAFADARTYWGVFQNRLNRLPHNDLATTITRDAWMIPFLGLLGYQLQFNQRAYVVDGFTFALSHRAGFASSSSTEISDDALPVHIVGFRQDLGRLPESGRPRMAPHTLVQDLLNRTEHLWSMVTNGRILRILRDCTFVRRQAYVEFDLQAIIEEQRFQDFAVLFRLIHRTRFPHNIHNAEDCLLEKYYQHSVEQGGRVRDHLREGVEECLKLLANGFLSGSSLNEELRLKVTNKQITPEELYRQLLKLVYRFLFLLVSEDRGLMGSNPIYHNHYGVVRLRRLVDNPATYTSDDDIWRSLQVVWRAMSKADWAAMLDLAPLNGELFVWQDLDNFYISNKNLLEAFKFLSWYQDGSNHRRVNYGALDVEELGSVYESLLDYHPEITIRAGRAPQFDLAFGSERKTTGSYYTPPQLVNELIKSALEPVIQQRLEEHPRQKEQALLSMRVCDPACGSGHFLLAAARRIGKELARVRSGDEEPSPECLREAVRDVIAHCIYGVDKNPLAVDLCRVALWLESCTSGKPLTFLDHRIRCGDSLVGVFDLNGLSKGIPDNAFTALEGDNRAVAQEYKQINRNERRGGFDAVFGGDMGDALKELTRHSLEVDQIPDDSPDAIHRKKDAFQQSRREQAWLRLYEACNLYTAAFFQRLVDEEEIITSSVLARRLNDEALDARLTGNANAIAQRQRFFHWPLEFPEVFANGGFDVILSNPPWERVKLQEQEFFSVRDADIATAPNKAARQRLIKALPKTNPTLFEEFVEALRDASGASGFMRNSERFPLTGRGDINTYTVFTELERGLIRPKGRSGIIVPSGIATDDTTKFFFQDLVKTNSIVSLFDFENRKGIFPAVHKSYKFCLLTMTNDDDGERAAEFVFFALETNDLSEPNKRFTLTAEEIELLNPNTGNCPIFRTQADAELTKAIYRRVPVLWREAKDGRPEENPWKLLFNRMFDMANDSHQFRTAEQLKEAGCLLEGNVFVGDDERYLPLYEAKMVHQFDHRWATYDDFTTSRDVTLEEKQNPNFVVQPRYWVKDETVDAAAPQYPEPLAAALKVGSLSSARYVLLLWAAGTHLLSGDEQNAQRLLQQSAEYDVENAVMRALGPGETHDQARRLAEDFPLEESDLVAIEKKDADIASLAREFIQRFSPKWFLGWRDITNTTNERTLIASVVPRTAVGDKLLLIYSKQEINIRINLLAILNSIVCDYAVRRKLGSTSLKYFIFKQIPVLNPNTFLQGNSFLPDSEKWLITRITELIYSEISLECVSNDLGFTQSPFIWDDSRRFKIRCELDAAFFHLYLPCENDGGWRKAENESDEQLATLKQHFPTPRDAVDYVLEQFPIVKRKDIAKHECFRTKERILEIYDAMLEAQRSGQPYQTTLNPPPGAQA